MRQYIRKSWWVVLLVGVLSTVYFRGIQEKESLVRELQGRLTLLEREKLLAQNEQQDLLLEIQSQNDPGWIELRLMEELGMTPQGAVKIYFNK